jgi:hypothetical protein
MAHGKTIEVETLDTPSVAAGAERGPERVMIPLQWMADAARDAEILGAMVLVVLQYTAFRKHNETFPLSNTVLARYGVSRDIKRRVLKKLEAAGRITVKWRGTKSPIVTLIGHNSFARKSL